MLACRRLRNTREIHVEARTDASALVERAEALGIDHDESAPESLVFRSGLSTTSVEDGLYGRGVGMISEISAQLISTFAENLCAKIQATSAGGAAPPETQAAPEISGLTLIAKALGNRLKR